MTSHTSIVGMFCAIGWTLACTSGAEDARPATADVPPGNTPGGGGPSSAGAGGSGTSSSGATSTEPEGGVRGELPLSPAAGSTMPCDVAKIVNDHCATCHAETPKFNAPMSLVRADDWGKTAPVSGSQPVRDVAARRIRAEGPARMPPPGTVEALQPAELEALSAWLEAGAPGVADGCSIAGSSPIEGGTAELLPRPTTTGTLLGPYEGWDADGVECYPFVTYQPGAADKATPYRVGTATDQYMGFGFKPPWQGTRFVRSFRSIIDNEQVLHHWILFEEPSAQDGSVSEIVGAHPGGQMLHGWAPGGSDLYFTPDVGIRMESNTSYLLEVHYNSSDPSAVDASGLEICVTEAPPENEAIISWLGTDRINGTSATGTCQPRTDEPIHIIAGTPHMHLKGSHMRVVVNRDGGGTDVIHDEAFSFENQRGYAEDVVIQPGDSITTSCTYTAPSAFGKGTNEEMCYWFALAYPAGALADGGFFGTLVHGENACLGL
jgi:mono/diheme cytochrome c family protein